MKPGPSRPNHGARPALLIATALCCVESQVGARTFEASPGDDIPSLAKQLKPGDHLHFTKGTYFRPFTITAKGTKKNPIRLTGDGEARFSGLETIDCDWTKDRNGIYLTRVDSPVTQLFADGTLMIPARWPNMEFDARWDNKAWRSAQTGSTYGSMVDPDLSGTGLDFTDCVAVLNIGAWQTFRRTITKHGKGQDHFLYPTDKDSRLHKTKHPVGMDRYCIYGRAALDAPGEWFYDKKTSLLHFIPPDGTHPRDLHITHKRNAEILTIKNSSHLQLTGFQFRGTTLRVENSNHCHLEDIHIEFGSAIANPFGPNLPHPSLKSKRWNARQWFGETSLDALTELSGNDNTIRNLTSRYGEGPALTVAGERNLIENCLFEDFDWHGLDYGFGLDFLQATPVTIRKVTLAHCGGSEGLRLANQGPSLVEYCHLHHCGLRQSDGAIIQTATAGVAGTEIRYNWIHDHNAFHWGGNGIRGDDMTRGLYVHHNVVWNCREKGIVTKGDNNRVHHNTCFNNPRIDILLPRNRLPGKPKEQEMQNQHSSACNNLGTVTGSWIWERPKKPPYAKCRNNTACDDDLRNPDSFDFQLKPDSPAIDAGHLMDGAAIPHLGQAPDLGAHELGSPDWKAGYQEPEG